MSRLRFGLAAVCGSVPEHVEWAKLGEAASYELLGYGDSQSILPAASEVWRDCAGTVAPSADYAFRFMSAARSCLRSSRHHWSA